MKVFRTLILYMFCQTFLLDVQAQVGFYDEGKLPFRQSRSILFGHDIIVNNQPDQDQRTPALCSAFNGWIFSVSSYYNNDFNCPAFTLMRSVDNGISWTVLNDGTWPNQGYKFVSMDIAAIGDSVSNLKIFIAGENTLDPYDMGEAVIFRFNGETGEFEDRILDVLNAYDIALATDQSYSASGSNPSSLGVIYSKYSINKDSLIFTSSTNGGIFLDNRKIVAVSEKHFHKVALAYGRSSTFPNGNYYAAWEEHNDYGSVPGHVYTSHTSPGFTSTFTPPIVLDSLDTTITGNCRNPSIACQFNNTYNDSLNLTEIVLFESFVESTLSSDIIGYYNLQAATSSHFNRLTLSNPVHNNLQPDITFNTYDSTFIVTYFDSTSIKLPYLINNYNLRNPDNWDIISTGYNDSTNISYPYPRVEVNNQLKEGANVWISDRNGGNGVTMFDAQYSTWTAISENTNNNIDILKLYPNPSNNYIIISFELTNPVYAMIDISNVLNISLGNIKEQYYPSGRNTVNFDVSLFPPGLYYCTIHTDGCVKSSKFTIIR